MDYYSCANSSANGHCRTSQEYQGGSPLNQTSQFAHYGHGGGSYNCSQISQGISSGYTDVYSESLDGMWINIPPGTCNGNYWIVMEVDPHNNFLEENDGNNWTAVPFTLTQQVPGGGDFAQISADGPTSFCEGGSVQLTASAGTSHLWSTGATTQSITVTTPGDYSCTVTGNCGTDATPVATVEVANTPQPQGTGATIMGSGSAQISATGTDVHWFDQSVGGSEMGSGNIFQTPVINTTTQYWAENRAGVAGLSGNVGKTDNTGGGGNSSVEQYLTFDALAAFTLKSVKVYAQGAGNRTFQVLSNGGGLIAQTTVNVPNGESRVNLDLAVPQGAGMRLYVTSTMRNLYRSNGGVSFPYTIADLVSITGSSAGANYYYYAYDWEVEGQSLDCISQRTQVTATVISGVQVNAKVRLEGPFDAGSGLMRDDLRMAGLVPVEEPYTGMGFSQVAGGGG
ncbi:MAG TPA: lysyl oxidase family protein, partial [Flavobacteriales bacterium]|nr:lysyl oxidase family protein [Flavobacteriales bacterium]